MTTEVGTAALMAALFEAAGFETFCCHGAFPRRPPCGCPFACSFGAQPNLQQLEATLEQAARPFAAWLRRRVVVIDL